MWDKKQLFLREFPKLERAKRRQKARPNLYEWGDNVVECLKRDYLSSSEGGCNCEYEKALLIISFPFDDRPWCICGVNFSVTFGSTNRNNYGMGVH